MKLRRLFLSLLIVSLSPRSFSTTNPPPSEILTKKEAFALLKHDGLKWKLTETLALEANGKTLQEKSETALKYELISKEIIVRSNPAIYGLESKLDSDLIAVGTTGLAFSYGLYDPASQLKLQGSMAHEGIVRNQVQQFQQDLTAALLVQYATVQKLERQKAELKNGEARAGTVLKLAEMKSRVGAGVKSELAKAKILIEAEYLKRLTNEVKLTKATQELMRFIGVRGKTFSLEDMTPADVLISETESSDLSSALRQRLDHRSAKATAEAADEAIQKLSKKFWPKVSVVGDIGSTDTTFAGLPGRRLSGLVAINLSIPLESGGLIEGKRAEMLALKNRATIGLQQSEMDLEDQVKQSRQQMTAARIAETASSHYVESVQSEMNIAQKKFSAGSASSMDLLTANAALAAALDTETEAIFNLELAKIQYFKAKGSFEGYFK